MARALELSGYQVIQSWREQGRVPAEYCPKIERLTNFAVRCEELNDRVDWGFLRSTSADGIVIQPILGKGVDSHNNTCAPTKVREGRS